MESAAADKPRFVYFELSSNCQRAVFSKTKTRRRAPVSPFLFVQRSGEARACSHEAAVPVAQALREERSTDVLSWTLAELAGRERVLAASQAKLAKRKLTASRLRSTTTMMTSVCVLLSVADSSA